MIKRFIILSFSFLFVLSSFAQDIKFEHYNDNDGLSHNSVRHVVQDKSHPQFEAQELIPVQRGALRSTDRLIWLTLLRVIELPQR